MTDYFLSRLPVIFFLTFFFLMVAAKQGRRQTGKQTSGLAGDASSPISSPPLSGAGSGAGSGTGTIPSPDDFLSREMGQSSRFSLKLPGQLHRSDASQPVTGFARTGTFFDFGPLFPFLATLYLVSEGVFRSGVIALMLAPPRDLPEDFVTYYTISSGFAVASILFYLLTFFSLARVRPGAITLLRIAALWSFFYGYIVSWIASMLNEEFMLRGGVVEEILDGLRSGNPFFYKSFFWMFFWLVYPAMSARIRDNWPR